MRRLTTEELYKDCPDMVPGQESKGVDAKYWFKCIKHGDYQKIFKDRRNGSGCKRCFLESQLLTTEQIYERCPDMVPGQESKGVDAKYWFKCIKHGQYEQKLSIHFQNKTCQKCGENNFTTERMYERCPDMVPGQEACGVERNYWFNCEWHGKYQQRFDSHSGCKYCNKGQKSKEIPKIIIPQTLISQNIRPKPSFLNPS